VAVASLAALVPLTLKTGSGAPLGQATAIQV
jgi:hypothetical protein